MHLFCGTDKKMYAITGCLGRLARKSLELPAALETAIFLHQRQVPSGLSSRRQCGAGRHSLWASSQP